MKRLTCLLSVFFMLLVYSSSAHPYLGLTLGEMKKKFGEPKKVDSNIYIFEWRAKADDKILKINVGDMIKVEAVVKEGKVAQETVYVPNKLDTQKDVLNWVWTYTGGKIRDINSPKTKALEKFGGEKAYYFTEGYWALPRIDPMDGAVMAIIVGRE